MKKTTGSSAAKDSTTACSRAWEVLIPARASYLASVPPSYDEVFHDVTERIQRAGSIGKTDIAALVVWKRMSAQTTWASALMSLPDAQVRFLTEQAVIALHDTTVSCSEAARNGRAVIRDLPGLHTGDALASAVLTAAAPTRMAVYDRHAHHALNTLGLGLTHRPGRYARYMQILDDILQHRDTRAGAWTARDIDTALYWTGRNPHLTATAAPRDENPPT